MDTLPAETPGEDIPTLDPPAPAQETPDKLATPEGQVPALEAAPEAIPAESTPPTPAEEAPRINPDFEMGETIKKVFAEQPAPVFEPSISSQASPTSPLIEGYTQEQLLDLKDTDPVRYDTIIYSHAMKPMNEKIANIPQQIQETQHNVALDSDVTQHIVKRNPEYSDPASGFSKDVESVTQRMKSNPALQRMAASALVEIATKQPRAINQAKQDGAREENKRASVASSAVGGLSSPQPAAPAIKVDSYYEKYGKQFGIHDTAGLQKRIDERNNQPKNSFVD